MTILSYLIPAVVILALGGLAMSVGVLVRGKGLQTCGRASGKLANGETIACPSCGGGGSCKSEKSEKH